MTLFNPNDIGQPNGHYFALPYSLDEAMLALISVPWDVTTSYRPGTAGAPQSIIGASAQVDLFDVDVSEAWTIKIGTTPFNARLEEENRKYRAVAEKIIAALAQGIVSEKLTDKTAKINAACEAMNHYVYSEARNQLAAQRIPAVVGGEHSVPFGLLRALSERYKAFGILHIDAHADLRRAYEGFTCSHASIMYNALQLSGVQRLTQVAVRDYCHDEFLLMQSDSRIVTFADSQWQEAAFHGKTWAAHTDEIVQSLPDDVYISFDIDGLTPDCCPNTGTPVPGGLSYPQAVYLLKQVAQSGRRIIGFDLCETAANANDANVAARLLYKLCCYTYFANRNHRKENNSN
ncbi:MAG: agmatinase family protein [Prevotellaceae bacterium]|jgi:agmatinase|nr:agmatinase family protein [Prevotellaceae bacterium]